MATVGTGGLFVRETNGFMAKALTHLNSHKCVSALLFEQMNSQAIAQLIDSKPNIHLLPEIIFYPLRDALAI